ncbi:MAG: hypothetical protein J6Y18_02855 [Candidatus Methanomethylophilaceae archaeon]|nr:hypothetical protein [Candidatus Methanomethylophilaceae archaeon]
MAIILVRYCEIGLKSTPVRRKFETVLRDNMLAMLASDHVEALISYGDARYYLESDDMDGCVASLKKVFGIASISVASQCTSEMEDICRTAAEYSLSRLAPGQSFAVRARREGTHPYNSMEVGKEAGSAIFLANEDKGISVDLHKPDKTFYIEIRNNKAFIFDEYIDCPGGLPMGSQGRVMCQMTDDRRSVVSAWTMMRRGCRVYVEGGDSEILRMYDPALRVLTGEESPNMMKDMMAKVSGAGVDGLKDYDYGDYSLPVFFPTAGMTDAEVDDLFESIRTVSF